MTHELHFQPILYSNNVQLFINKKTSDVMHFPLVYTNIFLRFKYDFENGSPFSCFFLSSVTVMTGYRRKFGVRYRVKEET